MGSQYQNRYRGRLTVWELPPTLEGNARGRSSSVSTASLPVIPVSIVLIDSHTVLRDGLRALLELEPDLRVIGEAANGLEGVRLVQSTRPTLVITDLIMPGQSGLSVIEDLRAADANLRVLVLTAHSDEEYLEAALRAGANAYVLKHATRSELLRAIRAVLAGQKYFCPAMSAQLVAGYLSRPHRLTRPVPITSREREVLTGIALGESNKRLAHALCLSVKTIEKHRANLMRKLALHNTAAVTLFAVRSGLVSAHGVGPNAGGELRRA